jgi:hypothetical protein
MRITDTFIDDIVREIAALTPGPHFSRSARERINRGERPPR